MGIVPGYDNAASCRYLGQDDRAQYIDAVIHGGGATMKKHTSLLSWCISIAIAISPIVHAAGEGSIQVAKAIGEDSSSPPAAPTQPGTDTAKTPDVPADSQPMSPAAKLGLAIAGLLALAGGGGGGGGGSTTTPHP